MEDRMCLKHIRDDQGNNNGIFLAVLDGHGGHQASEHVRRALWTTMSVNFVTVVGTLKERIVSEHGGFF